MIFGFVIPQGKLIKDFNIMEEAGGVGKEFTLEVPVLWSIMEVVLLRFICIELVKEQFTFHTQGCMDL